MSFKNRNRDKYTFANINLLGKCNIDCYFCLGKDIPESIDILNHLNTHFLEWQNFAVFVNECQRNEITKIYVTGLNTDSLQYKYLGELIDYLQSQKFTVGLRTNGYLAKSKIRLIQKCRGEIGYSIHSLRAETNKKIVKRNDILDWYYILNNSGDNVRVSIVLNRYNINEFDEIVRFVAQFDKVKYIQVRQVSTDKRFDELKEDIKLFEVFYEKFTSKHKQEGEFCLAQQFRLYGKEVIFWRTIATSVNSINYFTDGTLSSNYFVIEGYEQNLAIHKGY